MSVTKRTRPYALNLVTVQKYKSQEDKAKNNCSSLPAKLSSVLVPALAPAQTTAMNSQAFTRARLKSHIERVFQRISPMYSPGLKKLPPRAPPCSVNDSRLRNLGSLFPNERYSLCCVRRINTSYVDDIFTSQLPPVSRTRRSLGSVSSS